MAEAAVLESPSSSSLATTRRFYCHKCSQEISPLMPDFICPRCHSGFIEELEQQQQPQQPQQLTVESSNDLHEDDFPQGYFGFYEDVGMADDPSPDGPPQARRTRSMSWQSSPPLREGARRFIVDRNVTNVAPLEGILNQILANLTGGGGAGGAGGGGFGGNASIPIFFNLHGNPGDYAWGRGGLDTIITQLLNQLDCTGPPPLPKDKIGLIPTVHITKEQVDKTLQCTVCMDDFKVGEPVKRLLCHHHFHHGCIVPWLELHGTCPICRKSLNDDLDGNMGGSNRDSGASGSSSSASSTSSSSSSSSTSSTSSTSSSSSAGHSVYDFNEYD